MRMSNEKIMESADTTIVEPAYDPQIAEEAFETLRPKLQALPRSEVRIPNVDVQEAAVAALRLARHVAQPGVKARLAALDGRGFKLAELDELGPMAWAAWRARAGFVGAMA